MSVNCAAQGDLLDVEPIDGVQTEPASLVGVPANDNSPIPRHMSKLFTSAMEIEVEEAKEAGALGFMARAMVQASMPHRRVPGNEFSRTNGAFTMTMLAPSKVGLPYGSIPRLVTGFLTTEAVRTGEREVVLGRSLSKFMSELDIAPTGGRWGSIPRLRDQMTRLFACSISCTYTSQGALSLENVNIADTASLWWTPHQPDQAALWESTVVLSERFYNEITQNPVPIDVRALKALKKSPMALDVYLWLTYRMSYVKKRTPIPWSALQLQFGADYATTAQGRRDFKKAFLRALNKVSVVYPAARIDADTSSDKLTLLPSRPHVGRL